MKKTLSFAFCALVMTAMLSLTAFAASPGGGFQSSAGAAAVGGFSGPGIAPVSVEQAKAMRDDAHVVLRGNIVQHLGKDKYLFKDSSGTITVEIDRDKWDGQTVTPNDTVELYGEVDKDWNSVEIDVDRVVKAQ